jgi:hypothetical protein
MITQWEQEAYTSVQRKRSQAARYATNGTDLCEVPLWLVSEIFGVGRRSGC